MTNYALKIIEQGDRIIINCKITPSSSKNKIIGIYNGGLKISLQAPPEKGKANQALIKFLHKSFGLKNNQVEILSGKSNTLKTIAFYGLNKIEWEAALCKSLT